MKLKDYLALPAVSASTLWTLHNKSPWHVKYGKWNSTEAMALGSLLHALLLEPDTVSERFYRFTGTKQSNAKKDEWNDAEARGMEVVRDAAWAAAEVQAEGIRPHVPEFVAVEQTLTWTDERTGLDCKMRPDILTSTGIVDGKRAVSGHPAAFRAACSRYGHHWQAAWYLRGARANGLPADTWAWLVCEADGPATLYHADPSTLRLFESEIDAALDRYVECLATDTWPGYDPEALDLAGLINAEEVVFTDE